MATARSKALKREKKFSSYLGGEGSKDLGKGCPHCAHRSHTGRQHNEMVKAGIITC